MYRLVPQLHLVAEIERFKYESLRILAPFRPVVHQIENTGKLTRVQRWEIDEKSTKNDEKSGEV